jgi:ATP-binding cassette subfamily F protein 3
MVGYACTAREGRAPCAACPDVAPRAAKRTLVEWLRFADVARWYGSRDVFAGASGVLRDGATVGLVGPNGAGKSSLVRILAGLEAPDSGTLTRAKDSRLGYVSQAVSGDRDATLREILERAFVRMREEEARVRELETALEAASLAGDDDRLARALDAYGRARDAFDRHGGAGAERRMRSLLVAFGFDDADLDRSASDFSGGQRTRVALARVLLEEPDYLILDEPTNHLDLETVRWLEDFLIADPRAALVVSHDRYFLDRVANEIWELEGGKLDRYDVARGNAYGSYVEQKRERLELAARAYGNFKTEEKRRLDIIAELRTHGSHNYSHVRSREKQFDKLERVEEVRAYRPNISVSLEAARRATTGLALRAQDLTKAYDAPLFSKLGFDLARGERLALVGPNGAGKSTLLRILAERDAPDRGVVRLSEGMRTAYFSQDAADELPAGVRAVDAVLDGSLVSEEDARALLGRLGLGGDATDKPVEAFSGGERRRIMLARLMARSADLLFLDEPTNDLDIPSRESLEDVLAGYGGAMILVSHDRYLLRRLAQKVLELRDGAHAFYEGYDAFETRARARGDAPVRERGERGEGERSAAKAPSASQLEREQRQRREREKRELEKVERDVAALDAERVRLEAAFADPKLYDDATRLAGLKAELAETERKLGEAMERWERFLERDAATHASV